MLLSTPLVLAGRTAPSRALFGPHPTNLGDDRRLSERHVAYYARRAAGGTGLVVTETASVHEADWPYERAPLAAQCGPGWAAVAAACRPHGALVLAGLGHAGSQGTSAYSQQVLWAPSRVPDVASRELPAALEPDGIGELVEGFRRAARTATEAGLDGVEVDAGQHSLLRQFLSGLTNQRADQYGADRTRLLRQVLAAARQGVGPDRLVGLRLCCDELAPWAGITPEQGAATAAGLAAGVDYLVVVRGSAMGSWATRPDLRTEPGFNRELCRTIREAVAGAAPVVLQGSVVDPAMAEQALQEGTADLVELTRAQIADPQLVRHCRAGRPERVRPCVLCNARCQVRDVRNPLVSCLGEPRSGYETTDPDPAGVDPVGPRPDRVLVVGGGPAGLEAARVLALRGVGVELLELHDRLGGTLRLAARLPGRGRLAELADWLEAEVRRLGVVVRTGVEATPADLDGRPAVLLATGSRPAPPDYPAPAWRCASDVLTGPPLPPGAPVLVVDPVGDAVGAGIGELLAGLGHPVGLVTPDPVAAVQLALSGGLVEANGRLQRAGVRLHTRSRVRSVRPGTALVEHLLTGERTEVPAEVVVHCGHRLPVQELALARPGTPRAGDCVAPRTVYEAVLEGRRAALAAAGSRATPALAGAR